MTTFCQKVATLFEKFFLSAAYGPLPEVKSKLPPRAKSGLPADAVLSFSGDDLIITDCDQWLVGSRQCQRDVLSKLHRQKH